MSCSNYFLFAVILTTNLIVSIVVTSLAEQKRGNYTETYSPNGAQKPNNAAINNTA